MSFSSAWFGVFLVQASAGLSFPLIHRTSLISRFSYDSRSDMISIISLFSFVVPSLTRQSYRDFESVQITIGIGGISKFRTTWLSVALNAMALSNPLTIPYSSLARTLLVTRLHLTEFQCTILPWISKLSPFSVRCSVARTIRNPSCELKSLLFAKAPSVKMNSFARSSWRGIYVSPQFALSICH